MKPEVQVISKPIPEGLDCGDEFSEDEMIRIRMLREIIKSSECDYFLCKLRFCFKLIVFPEYPLLNIRTDDNFMARFLCGPHNSATSPEKAADKIYALYKFRVSLVINSVTYW